MRQISRGNVPGMSRKRLILIDGYSLLFRAFYGTRFLSTSDGTPTNALFGFTGMLFSLLETTPPDAVVVALDAPGKTFRHTEFAEYKGTRHETPPELENQLAMAREFLTEMGVPIVEVVGYEADDVVGTIARKAQANGYDTTIVSGDLDQVQLVDDSISVLTTRVGVSDTVTYTPDAVLERFGVPPSAIPDWKAIVGDKSDNIPGVPGIGEKGATVLLQRFGSVEEMLRRIDEVEPKYRKKIEPVAEQIPKSKWLATIACDAPLEYDFAPFSLTPEQYERACAMLERLEFRNHLRRAPAVLGRYVVGGGGAGTESGYAVASVSATPVETSETTVGSLAELRSFVGDAEYAILPDPVRSQPGMFGPGAGDGSAWVAVEGRSAQVPMSMALELFASNPGKAIVHDAKPLFKRVPPTTHAVAFDTYLAGYVLQAGRSNYSLRDLIQGYLEIDPPERPSAQAEALRRLKSSMQSRVEKEGQRRVLFEVELPLTPVLAEMENHGICASADFLHDFSKLLEREIEQAAARVYELAGDKFNIGSPKQLGEILFEKLGIPGQKKTKTGYATGAEVLLQIAPSYPIASEVLTWRELTKLKSTYADALPKMIGPDGRIRTTFNQSGAATGRLSSNDPNLQNIPIRTDLGREIRKAFVAPEGMALTSFDYSQIELRLLAHMCQDPALVEAFQEGADVHAATAALMFDRPIGEIDKRQRGYAKLLNFAVLYGVTDFGLANQLGGEFSVSEAKDLIQQYFERFPRVKEFTESVVAEARAKGFTTTLLGRRRTFPDIHSANRNERLYAERQAVNAPIQGTAADMIKLAMVNVRKTVGREGPRMLLQVHDELVFETGADLSKWVGPIREAMEGALPLSVPVVVDAKTGPNWAEMEPIR